MANLEGAATVCEKCRFAIWVRRQNSQPTIDRIKSGKGFFDLYYYPYDCGNCGNELDEKKEESKVLRLSGTVNKLEWRLPAGDDVSWKDYATTHLVCVRCQKEDRNIRYNYLEAYKNSCVPNWHVINYIGITSWGPNGGEPWMEKLILCQECHAKTDTEEWLKQTIGLVLVKQGNPSPHKLSLLLEEVQKNFPHIKLKPPPWG